ncbi:MAG: ABC transporter ATP-binding protein [Clostridia bacterium]|nr:ABC transporter ATP-binding protein [Clostridia bacterium]
MKLREHISIAKRAVKMVFGQSKTFALCTILNSFLAAITPYVPIWFSAKLIDALFAEAPVETLILYVTLTVGIVFLLQLLKTYVSHQKNISSSVMYRMEDWQYAEKAMRMSYESIESRDVQLLRNRIRMETQTGYNRFYLHMCMEYAVRYITEIFCSLALTVSFFMNRTIPLYMKLGLLALLVLTVVCNIMLTAKQKKEEGFFYEQNVMRNTVGEKYSQYIGDYSAGMDIRLYQMAEDIVESQSALNREYTEKSLGLHKKLTALTVPQIFLSHALQYMTYLVLIVGAIAGSVSVGSIAKYVSCIMMLLTSLAKLVAMFQISIVNHGYLKRYFSYFDIPNNMYQGSLTVEKRDDNEYYVEFRDVSFKYPGSDVWALRHVNLKFKVGEKLAVVGMNGSGKTTFIKLLCRLYDPAEGEILLNGVNIKKYNYDEYMSVFSVVFQDYRLFAFTLGQNVAASTDYDEERVKHCLHQAGFKERLETLPNGTETYLFKNYDKNGVEFSGGETQKIALARALYKDAPFIILDEPTAALDPVSEYEVYSNFNRISGEKTAIYISHRLASCRFCDKIAVFDHGEIIQRGSHDELVADKNGKYYELWHAQAQYYTE